MPEQHLEVVRKLIDHWNAGDRDTGLLEIYLEPEVRLESPVASLTGAAYEGHSGIERWMSDLDDQFSEWSIAVGEIRDAREEVIALVGSTPADAGAPRPCNSRPRAHLPSPATVASLESVSTSTCERLCKPLGWSSRLRTAQLCDIA